MKQIYFIAVALLLTALVTDVEARRKKHKSDSSYAPSAKTKTKTKWSTSTDNGPNGGVVATEEHGYYVKRTYLPMNSTGIRQSPPYLAIPIAWFSCAEGKSPADCHQSNSAAISGVGNAMTSDGFLCDDDCVEPYAPICGKTNSEVAVFYSQCKLNVAKCRTHGLWQDFAYAECQQMYPKETAYTDKKFRSSPFFKEAKVEQQTEQVIMAAEPVPVAAEQPVDVATTSSDSSKINENNAFNEVNDKVKTNENMSVQNVAHPAKTL